MFFTTLTAHGRPNRVPCEDCTKSWSGNSHRHYRRRNIKGLVSYTKVVSAGLLQRVGDFSPKRGDPTSQHPPHLFNASALAPPGLLLFSRPPILHSFTVRFHDLCVGFALATQRVSQLTFDQKTKNPFFDKRINKKLSSSWIVSWGYKTLEFYRFFERSIANNFIVVIPTPNLTGHQS
jgi:hypothetical protein